MRAKVNSWVRFYSNGRLVIGEVEYVERDILGYDNYHTDHGSVREDSVLEVRNQKANVKEAL